MKRFRLIRRAALLITLMPLLFSFTSAAAAQDDPSEENHIYLWDAATGDLINGFDYGEEDIPFSVQLNADGSHIIAAFLNGDVLVYNINLPRPARMAEHTFVQEDPPRGAFPVLVPIHPPNQILIQEYGHFWLWDYAVDRILVEGDGNWVQPNPEGSRLLVGDSSGVQVIDIAAAETLFSVPTERVLAQSWSPDGTKIALATMEGVFVYDAASGGTLYQRIDDRFGDAYSETLWSPNGLTLMAVASPSLHYEDTEILLIDAAAMTERLSIPFDDGVFSAQWSANSARILVAQYNDSGAQVFEASTGERVSAISAPSSFLSAEWNRGEDRLVALADGRSVFTVWDIKNLTVMYEAYTSGLIDLYWTNDRTAVLARIWPDGIVNVIDFDTFTGDPIRLLHADNVNGAAWSGDGTRIVTWTGPVLG